MGGKTGTTTQSVQIPPEVMARYNAVNTRAESTAQQPFQQYSTDPSSFVAQLNQQQQKGISNVNQYADAAQPAYQAAMQGTGQAYQGYNAPNYQQGVQGYMSPFLSNAMGATAAQMQNINRQQQQDILGNAVKSGAFGGDRGAIARSALANQQNLASGQVLGQMAQTGYQDAARNYMAGLGQQGALAAQMGALGTGAQTAGLQGAQAQIGAGTLGQQTEQAGKTALYNQYLQKQAYPFQVAQFLANIAMGTGALSGSTTTTTQPMPFFSDRRLKEDVKRIGESDEGLPIYKYKYKGDPNEQTHIGFMADEVEQKHPEAVGIAAGYKTVDYDKATSEGGAVAPQHEGKGFAMGGMPYGGGIGYVPESNLPVGKLMTAGSTPSLPESSMSQLASLAEKGIGIAKGGKDFYDWGKEHQFFASGGIASEDPNITEKTKLDIPTETDKHSLAVAGAPPSQGNSGMSDLANVAKFAMMFMGAKDGGRIGYAEGGDPEDSTVGRILSSLSNIESGGRYGITGPETRGDKPYGKYQIMGANVGPWTKQYLGQEMTPEEFLRNPDAQENLMRSRVSQQLSSGTSPEDIASIHFTGRPVSEAGNRRDVLGTSVQDYVSKFNKGMGIAAGKSDMPAEGGVPAQAAAPAQGEGGIGNFFTENQGWLAPLGAGLKSMVSSKSPYLGAALLEGVGAGLEAYPAAQKTLQDIEYSKAAQAKVISEIPQNAIVTDSSGRTIGVKVYIGNKLTMVPIADYMRAQREGKPYSVVPQPYGPTSATAPTSGTISTPEGDLTVEARPVPAGAAQPRPAGQAAAPVYQTLSPDLEDIARQNAEGVQTSGFKNLETSAAANPFDEQQVIARGSQADLQQRNTLTKSLGSIPREQSLLASGKFSEAVSAPVVGYVNNLFSILGRPDIQIARPEDLANRETAEKISRMLAEKRTTQAGQRAYGALEAILAAVPSAANSPEGQANLLADLYYTQQREVDLDRFYRLMQKSGQDQTGITTAEARYMGTGLYDEFAKRNEQNLAKEKAILKEMYITPFTYKDYSTGETVPTFLLPYLAGKSGSIPDNVRKAIQKKYKVGPEFFRYFSGQ